MLRKKAPRVVKVGYEKDRQILKATLLEDEVDAYAQKHGIHFTKAIREILNAKRLFTVAWRRRST